MRRLHEGSFTLLQHRRYIGVHHCVVGSTALSGVWSRVELVPAEILLDDLELVPDAVLANADFANRYVAHGQGTRYRAVEEDDTPTVIALNTVLVSVRSAKSRTQSWQR